ncbi:MAG: hypothetical protein CR967_02815 [Proteobacteria bacterium]|nr:MAG: hypothetical protein CR967_02815 [Pseudomonadota bacterium]
MVLKNFKNGRKFSIGLELELRILNANDLSFANEYKYIKNNISPKYKKYITPEFLQCMIEISTPVFKTPTKAVEFLKEIISELKKLAKKKNLVLHASGLNALKQKKAKISNSKRYAKIHDTYKILVDDFYICGIHIHIGFEDFQKALNAYNFSIKYLPIFVALSSSSPFFNGENTGIHSFRTKIFDRLSRASIPEYFDSFEQMEKCYSMLYKTGVIKNQSDIWWDLRIKDELKTIEFRVVDAIGDFERLEILVGLARGICILAQSQRADKVMMQILKENMWNASRYSMDADFIDGVKRKNIRFAILDLINKLKKEKIIDKSFYKRAKKIANEPSIAQEMLKLYEKNGDLEEIERMSVLK